MLGYAVAVYDYAATATTQLSLKRADRVAITSRAGNDKGWWKGEHCTTGKVSIISTGVGNSILQKRCHIIKNIYVKTHEIRTSMYFVHPRLQLY